MLTLTPRCPPQERQRAAEQEEDGAVEGEAKQAPWTTRVAGRHGRPRRLPRRLDSDQRHRIQPQRHRSTLSEERTRCYLRRPCSPGCARIPAARSAPCRLELHRRDMNARPDLDVLLSTELWPGERERLLRAVGLASRSGAPASRREPPRPRAPLGRVLSRRCAQQGKMRGEGRRR